jgi:hypothetical protein
MVMIDEYYDTIRNLPDLKHQLSVVVSTMVNSGITYAPTAPWTVTGRLLPAASMPDP